MKSIPRILWFVPAFLLFVAVWPLPYGYYTFIRIVTCGVATLIAVAGMRERADGLIWSVLLATVAILFNPFIPIHLNRTIWFYLDWGATAAFLAHLVIVRQKLT